MCQQCVEGEKDADCRVFVPFGQCVLLDAICISHLCILALCQHFANTVRFIL